MASFGTEFVYNSTLRPPANGAHDSQSCAITRGSVPSDMVAFGSQHGSAGPGLVQQRFATIQYPGTKELLVPRDGVTPGWNEEFINLIAQHKRSHILREEPPTLQHFIQVAQVSTYDCFNICIRSLSKNGNRRTQTCFISYATRSI